MEQDQSPTASCSPVPTPPLSPFSPSTSTPPISPLPSTSRSMPVTSDVTAFHTWDETQTQLFE